MSWSAPLLPLVLLLVCGYPGISSQDLGLWPLVTPLLGVDDECLSASLQYISLLNEAFTTNLTLTREQKEALQMFDSNGRFPFLQEDTLQDIAIVDLCDDLLEGVPNCRETLPPGLRYLRVPLGNANGPGAEFACKAVSGAKYCHNYYQFYLTPVGQDSQTDTSDTDQFTGRNANPKQFLNRPRKPPSIEGLRTSLNYDDLKLNLEEYSPKIDLDPSKLINLHELLLEKNSYLSQAHRQLSAVYQNTELFPQSTNTSDTNQLVGILLNFWMQVNFLNGVGEWGFSFPVVYQGMCFPAACDLKDINMNSLIYGLQFTVGGEGLILSSPVINEGLGQAFNFTMKQQRDMSVGCSDDYVYSGEWRTENYIVVTLLGIIAFFILLGTAMDTYEKDKRQNMGYQIVKAFSLKENLKFIFDVPAAGGSGSVLHVKNVEYVNQVKYTHAGGLLFEAVMQGEYSVDTFLFIGATLLSFLLLKDLDKSNGWFSSGAGFVRMILFYVNRYLRITIPYALAVSVTIGVMPLVFSDYMDAGRLAYTEAENCKKSMGYHMAYINIWPDYGFNEPCMGQTWYLSCDMLLFILSPLLIYPLWKGKSATLWKVFSILWWTFIFLSSCTFAYWYVVNIDRYNGWMAEYRIPDYNFSPWGWRSQCYILGIMTGYILWLTKDKTVVINRKLNVLIWANAVVLGLLLVFRPYRDFRWDSGKDIDLVEGRSFYAFRKAGWGLCLMWVTFSCCRGYGGIVNDFLSWGFWQPISKVSFMTYLFHMSLNWYFFLLQPYPVNFSMWQLTSYFVPQVWFCLLTGLLGSLSLELPFGKIQKILIQRLLRAFTK